MLKPTDQRFHFPRSNLRCSVFYRSRSAKGRLRRCKPFVGGFYIAFEQLHCLRKQARPSHQTIRFVRMEATFLFPSAERPGADLHKGDCILFCQMSISKEVLPGTVSEPFFDTSKQFGSLSDLKAN
jgi:hypothetical protein